MIECKNCAFSMHYTSKVQDLAMMLDKFPPYHGEGYNYTKAEVEDWLKMARTIVAKAMPRTVVDEGMKNGQNSNK